MRVLLRYYLFLNLNSQVQIFVCQKPLSFYVLSLIDKQASYNKWINYIKLFSPASISLGIIIQTLDNSLFCMIQKQQKKIWNKNLNTLFLVSLCRRFFVRNTPVSDPIYRQEILKEDNFTWSRKQNWIVDLFFDWKNFILKDKEKWLKLLMIDE